MTRLGALVEAAPNGAATTAVVAAREVEKVYETSTGRKRAALRGVTLAVERGSFTSIMGPSGSGKSTLLHIFGGLVSPTHGTVELDGVDLGALGDDELAEVRRHQVGFVFQAFNLVPVLTALENVALPGVIAGAPRQASAQRAGELLELVGLAAETSRLPTELSGGEQQRVAIARALLMQPAVLLADEPTGNLDSGTGSQVLEVLRRTHAELGQTTVVVTHDARVAAVGDNVLHLVDGLIDGRLELSAARRPAGADARERAVLRWLQRRRVMER